MESGRYILGNEVRAFEQEFARAMNARWSIGVASGTDAIELALRVVGVTPGDGVLTVSHTAVATVAAIARVGAFPLFVDIDPLRYTMSPASLAEALELTASKAKAIVVVHLYGQAANLQAILELSGRFGLPVIEDCAQAHGAKLQERTVGTWGDIGCFSFYPTKNLGAFGDAGALIGRDEHYAERMRSLREYGWQTRYLSTEFGVNSRLDELQAAILRVKLPGLRDGNTRRQRIADLYDDRLAGSDIVIPYRAPDGEHVFHQYVVQAADRDRLQKALAEAGVGTLVHYPAAVHQQPAYDDQNLRPVALPNTESVVPRILSLPMYPELTSDQVEYVCTEVLRHIG
jgi:dTDP-4-amino-4,6-dideoxygalactose transaminase